MIFSMPLAAFALSTFTGLPKQAGSDNNSKVLDAIKQSSAEGNFKSIVPLLGKLTNLDGGNTERLAGLVNGTLVVQLEPKDRPLMLQAVRIASQKMPLDGGTGELYYCQTIETEARILEVLGRHDEAMKLIDTTDDKVNSNGRAMLSGLRNHLSLVGTKAQPVLFDKNLGDFPGLEAWKGKVVVIDFFAHWCVPCIAEFPEMKEIYGESHSQGLELLGATEFYGYYEGRKNLPKDDEFEAMKGFVTSHGLPWPVVFIKPSVKDEYRQMGLPNVIVIDRHGVIREVGFGFYPGEKGKLSGLVKSLLLEK